jgi:hypothetical protein
MSQGLGISAISMMECPFPPLLMAEDNVALIHHLKLIDSSAIL